jgi:hypothetical protein
MLECTPLWMEVGGGGMAGAAAVAGTTAATGTALRELQFVYCGKARYKSVSGPVRVCALRDCDSDTQTSRLLIRVCVERPVCCACLVVWCVIPQAHKFWLNVVCAATLTWPTGWPVPEVQADDDDDDDDPWMLSPPTSHHPLTHTDNE